MEKKLRQGMSIRYVNRLSNDSRVKVDDLIKNEETIFRVEEKQEDGQVKAVPIWSTKQNSKVHGTAVHFRGDQKLQKITKII